LSKIFKTKVLCDASHCLTALYDVLTIA